jgi:hypothetical protein
MRSRSFPLRGLLTECRVSVVRNRLLVLILLRRGIDRLWVKHLLTCHKDSLEQHGLKAAAEQHQEAVVKAKTDNNKRQVDRKSNVEPPRIANPSYPNQYLASGPEYRNWYRNHEKYEEWRALPLPDGVLAEDGLTLNIPVEVSRGLDNVPGWDDADRLMEERGLPVPSGSQDAPHDHTCTNDTHGVQDEPMSESEDDSEDSSTYAGDLMGVVMGLNVADDDGTDETDVTDSSWGDDSDSDRDECESMMKIQLIALKNRVRKGSRHMHHV